MTTTTRPAPDTRPLLLRHGPYRRLLIGIATSAAGSGVAAVALPVLAVSVFAASPRMIGVLEAAVWTPWLILGLPTGAWVDRWSPRRMALIADSCSMVLFGAVPVLAALDALRLWHLVVLAFAAGSTAVVSEAAAAVLPPTVVQDADLNSANSGLQSAESVTDVLSPALSGGLVYLFGIVSAFTANAASFAVSVICLRSLRPVPLTSNSQPATGQRVHRQIADGLRVLLQHRILRRLAGTAAAVNVTLTGVGVLQALLLINEVGVSPGTVGLLLIGEGIGGVAGAALAAPLAHRLGAIRALAVVPAVTFPFGLLTALTYPGTGLTLFVLGTGIPTVGVVATNVLMRSARQRAAPPALLGRVSASSQVIGRSAAPVAALVSGVLASSFGVRPTIAGFWIFGLGAAALLLFRPLHLADGPS